jgi:hypothetical protein
MLQVRVVEIMSSGKVSVSQKSEEEAAQEKQMASGGMSSGVSTAGMSLLQAALARAGVSAETFATEVGLQLRLPSLPNSQMPVSA